NLQLIAEEELHEIRRIWVYDKHEFDDSLPRIYQEVTGTEFPRRPDEEAGGLRADDWALLREVCGDDPTFLHLQAGLLGEERKFRGMSRRAGIYDALEAQLRTALYGSEAEAVAVLAERARVREQAQVVDAPAEDAASTDSPAPDTDE